MVFHGGISLKRLEKIVSLVSLKRKILLAAAFAAAVFVCGGCKKAGQDEIFLETVAESCDETGSDEQLVELDVDILETETEGFIYVHVCGQVKQPGVYSLKKGSRLYEAIDMAGGITENGVSDALNLAAVLEDGMRIMVPDEEQAGQWMENGNVTAGMSETPEKSGKVNLNRASVEELMILSGIGQSRAEAIVRYREEIGSFQTIEDVMKVSGIKENAFNKIKDNITV